MKMEYNEDTLFCIFHDGIIIISNHSEMCQNILKGNKNLQCIDFINTSNQSNMTN